MIAILILLIGALLVWVGATNRWKTLLAALQDPSTVL